MHAQELITKVWEHTTGAPDTVDWSAQVQDATGNIYITGNTISGAELANVLTTVYDRFGDVKWQAEYNSSYDDNDYGTAIAIDDDLNVYVAAASYTSATNYYDYLVIKYDSTGSELWTATYNGPGSLYDIPSDILIDGSGNVYVTGGSVGSSTGWDYATVKYNSSGTQQWVSRYNYNDHDDAASGLATNSSGQILVTGASAQADDNWDFASVKYNQSTGAQITAQRNTASGLGIDRVNSIAIDADDNVYLTGRAAITSEGYNIRTIKLDSLLATIWNKQYNLADLDDEGMSVWVDGEGNVYVTGTATADNDKTRGVTIKYNSAGTLQWTVLETPNNGEALNSSNRAMSISEDGQIMVAGTAENGADTDIMTYVYDEDGNRLWAERWDGGDDDQASFIHADGDNEIFTGGISQDGGSSTYTLIKYRRAAYITPPDDDPDKPAYAGWWENRGQIIDTDDNIRTDIKYYADRHYPALYATDDSLFMVFSRIDTSTTTDDTLARIDMGFVGSSSTKEIMKTTSQGGEYRNFFLAHTGADGVTNVQKTDRLYTKDLYPKVDLMHYFDQAGVKFYLIIQPGYSQQNDPIEMVFNGADITFNADTTLTLETEIGGITLRRPEAYQIETDGSRTDLTWHPEYTDEGSGVVGLSLGSYTTTKVLVLEFGVEKELLSLASCEDNVIWGTYWGGDQNESIEDIKFDYIPAAMTPGTSTITIAGFTRSANFPEEIFMDTELSGDVGDIFIQKFSSTYVPQWGVVIGGSSVEGSIFPFAKIDTWNSPDGTGYTPLVYASFSSDLPTLNTVSGSDIYKSTNSGGSDGALAIFDPYGDLYFSTYIGGSGNDDMEDVKETSDNGLILVGYSSSTGGALELKDFNTGSTDDVYYPGTRQGYILEVDQELNAVWGTKFGSGPAVYERAKGVFVDENDDFVITGITSSSGLPTTAGAFQAAYAGSQDAFIVKIDHTTKEIDWCTYFGGANGQEESYSIVVDNNNDVYVVGMYHLEVNTPDFPLQSAGEYFDNTYSASEPYYNEGFLIKMDEDGDLLWSTYYGGDGQDWIFDIATDGRLIAITGAVRDENDVYPLVDYSGTYFDDVIDVNNEENEVSSYIAVFDRNTELIWSTFLGDKASSAGHGVSFDPATDVQRRLFVAGAISYEHDDYLTFEPLCDPGFGGYYHDEPLEYIPDHPYANADGFILGFDIDGFPEDPPVGLEFLNNEDLHIYPNPTEGQIVISTTKEVERIQVFSITGQLIYRTHGNNKILDLGNISNGMYLIEVMVEGVAYAEEIILNR
ncbi:MAG: T9SS type A sorting domain-containing protein [Chitinophagales bacterium]|nr:T9SS type A sorting domain-containing protein [Chitinophagales bacterium]